MSKLYIVSQFNLNAEYGQWRGQGALCPGQHIGPRVARGSSDGRDHPLLGILQHQLETSLDPLPCDSSRASASAPRWYTDQYAKAGEGLHTHRGPAVG